MKTNNYIVDSLAEYYDAISYIAEQDKQVVGQPLWFRGHPYANYFLSPSIMRKNDSNDTANCLKTYNLSNLREDYRLQNYKARVYHLTQSKPTSKLEWQALYQHNFGKTRLLDWSESARTALSFALEAFIDPRELDHLKMLRRTITPVVWVLNPRRLNQKVYEYIGNEISINLLEKALYNLNLQQQASSFRDAIKNYDGYINLDRDAKDDIEIDGIINLGVIDERRMDCAQELTKMVERMEFNPFFYLCLRLYADALPVEICKRENVLPPLAILHQYQSERIRAQRGVFTIFPNYTFDQMNLKYKKLGYDRRIMENQPYIMGCLHEIRIINPNRVAKELLYSGERRTELYPENEYYAHTMEADQFRI